MLVPLLPKFPYPTLFLKVMVYTKVLLYYYFIAFYYTFNFLGHD